MRPAQDWLTLRELDRSAGREKGAAFRAFKRLSAGYREGVDFVVLSPDDAAATIDALRASGRIYAGSVNVVLLAAGFAETIAASLEARATP
ncbi:MAG: hypothetical protein QM661_09925 [Solimonas sp.]